MHVLRPLLPVLLALLVAAGCSRATPEQEIRDLIEELADAAEDGKVRRLAAAISDDYRDVRGNDKRAVTQIMLATMLRSDELLIFERVESVGLLTRDLAEADVTVRFAGASLERLSLNTSRYLFVLELERRDGDWLITSARWAPQGREPR